MNMFARFDENPAMTLRVIKETKHYGRTDGQRENSIPPTNKVCGGYNDADQTVSHGSYSQDQIHARIQKVLPEGVQL